MLTVKQLQVELRLHDVLLGPPHDVQRQRVDPRRKLLLRLDERDLLPRVQILDHHTGQNLLFLKTSHTLTLRRRREEEEGGGGEEEKKDKKREKKDKGKE